MRTHRSLPETAPRKVVPITPQTRAAKPPRLVACAGTAPLALSGLLFWLLTGDRLPPLPARSALPGVTSRAAPATRTDEPLRPTLPTRVAVELPAEQVSLPAASDPANPAGLDALTPTTRLVTPLELAVLQRRHAGEVRYCYHKLARRKVPRVQPKSYVVLKLGPAGRVSSVDVHSAGQTELQHCLALFIKQWQFPPEIPPQQLRFPIVMAQ